jgi:hypothetical protein
MIESYISVHPEMRRLQRMYPNAHEHEVKVVEVTV